MQAPWLNSIGDWNPQFLRECRGRLKPRSIAAAITLSAIAQLLMYLSFVQRAQWTRDHLIDWGGLWTAMIWLMTYGLIAIGSYFLINDITQEDRLGTLNFIRLSPRPGQEILWGKLLGVPILCYLAVAVAIPLHGIAAMLGGVGLVYFLSFYLMLLAGAIFFFSAALLIGFLTSSRRVVAGQQSAAALAFTIPLVLSGIPAYLNWNFQTVWRDAPGSNSSWRPEIQWVYLPLSSNLWLAHFFTLVVFGIGTAFLWRMLLRRFLTPRSTAMSKRMSYALVAFLEVVVLGFALHSRVTPAGRLYINFPGLYIFNFLLFLGLIFILCPLRQELLDWLRFRYSVHGESTLSSPQRFSWLGALRDLVWVDSSPGVVAIALNLLIVNALVLPCWMLLTDLGIMFPMQSLLTLASVSMAVLIETAVIQWIFTSKIRNPGTWAAGILGVWLTVPITILNILQVTPDKIPAAQFVFTILGYPFTNLARPSTGWMVAGLILQGVLLVFLMGQLQRKLRQLTPNAQSILTPGIQG
jgi:hypothetical protein